MAEAALPKSSRKLKDEGWLRSLDDLLEDEKSAAARKIGGKAARLVWLKRNGFEVPATWVLPQKAFVAAVRQLSPSSEPRSLLRAASSRSVYARAADAREEILRAPLPDGLEAELSMLWRTQKDRAPWGFAVRSSATCEDGAIVSMAGLAETVLGVRGVDGLANAVRVVWASIASGRALSYLANSGVKDVGMGVVIQPMVRAIAAGVMFTRGAKASSSSSERIINAGVGLGSPVVDGVTTPDMLRVAEDGSVLEQTIARKSRATVVGADGLAEIAVERPDEPALRPEHVTELAHVAAELERHEDVAWDVEFACDGERVVVVQARHVTGLGFPAGGGADTVWSNVNVGEALPGVATPFTWSVAGAYSEAGFRKAFGTLGCSVPKSAVLVGNVHGRFYLNLTEFMQIAAQVPWLDPRTLVDLGGGSGGDELALQIGDVSRTSFYAKLPLTAARLLREQLRIDDHVSRFEDEAERALRDHNALDLAILPDEGVGRKLRDVQALLERTGDVMLTCASSALGSHILLKGMVARVAGGDDAERIAHDLTAGIRDLESARPAIGMMRVVNLARRDKEARSILERDNATMDALPEGPVKRALASFLELYGDRAVREAEISTPRWKEDPRPIFAMIRVALRTSSEAEESSASVASVTGDADALLGESRLRRAKAIADAEMERLFKGLGFVNQTAVRHLVARAQKAARLRERMRTWVTRALGMMRDVALDADRRLLRLVPDLAKDWARIKQGGATSLAATHTVFFLTIDEVVQALRASRTDLAPLVRARRAELARDWARPDPPRTFTGAPPPVQLPPSGGTMFKGTAASSGVVEGRARVLLSAAQMDELQPGEVLVVHTTDVGWTPLFCIAAGVVTELGGPLSHAAVVARELAVPSVVNVDGITRALRTGDRVRLDGDAGTIEKLPA
ncbi:MAG: phosphoenolpyruvate synthase [Labilithrix sp.]|nr:phosphoenolpyruvate synthase [Labilithrix sp.]MCW5810584.1 phosphoenolpyruvate synthase [Labilithrix sp.]